MARRLGIGTVLLSLVTLALGCGGGYEKEEARAACDALVGQVATSDQAAYDDCMDCHMECGDDCTVLTSFPPQFACED